MSNTKYLTGSIPEKITYISQEETKIVNSFEDGEEINSFAARPTFVANNEKSKQTGIEWAKRCYSESYINGEWVRKEATEPVVLEVDNRPFGQLRITSYERRSEGGGAFKMIVEDKYYVDLRTDTLLDIFVNSKIEFGEVTGCKFIWARIGAQMKVVRIGSEIHKRLIKVSELKASPIKKSELKQGDILESPSGDKKIFLGYVNTLKFNFEETRNVNYYNGGGNYTYHFENIEFKKNIMVFLYTFGKELPKLNKQGTYSKFLSSIPKMSKVGEEKVPANWMELIMEESDQRNYHDSSGQFLTETGKFPELLPVYEKYRKEYEELKTKEKF